MVSYHNKLEKDRGNHRPVIAVTGPDKGGDIAWIFINFAVRIAGGRPVRITPSRPKTTKKIQGVIISGGSDVDPRLYGEKTEDVIPDIKQANKSIKGFLLFLISLFFFPLLYVLRKLFSMKSVKIIDRKRDKLEYKFIDYAVSNNLPVLGICRGAQLINVYFGGSLFQDIKSFYVESPQIRSILPKKKIQLKQKSKLAGILHCRTCNVNALHHQAIKEAGDRLQVVARETSDVIQAIEHSEKRFVLGVQWHPEFLPQMWRQRQIFKQMILEASHLKN